MPINPLVGSELVGLGGNLLNGLFGIGGQKMQFDMQKKLIDHQFEKNVEMWNKQNEYNSPTAQMKRLQDAGLNPNLVYGDGAVGNSAGSPPEYGLAKAPNYGESINNMLQPFTLQGQLIAQQIQESKSREELNGVENMLKTLDKQFAERTLDERVDFLFKENEKKLAKYGVDIALGKNQIRLGNSQIFLNFAQMNVANKNASFIEENTRLTKNQADLLGKRLSVFDIEFAVDQAFKKSQTANNYAQVSEAQARTTIHQLEAFYKAKTMKFRVGMDREKYEQEQYASQKAFFDMKINTDPKYMAGVVMSKYFQALTAEEQYKILNAYGMQKAWREAYGAGESFIGGPVNGFIGNVNNLWNKLGLPNF